MVRLAEQAADMDAETPAQGLTGADALMRGPKAGTEEQAVAEDEEEQKDANGDMAGLLQEFGLSEQSLMDILERMEGMEGGKEG